MARTISGLLTNGQTLSPGDLPLTVALDGAVRALDVSAGVLSVYSGAINDLGTLVSYTLDGVDLVAGGIYANGNGADTAAFTGGQRNGLVAAGAATVYNYGTVAAETGIGVSLASGGQVWNGNATDAGAIISAALDGVRLDGGLVANAGTIASHTADGVIGADFVSNGSDADTVALIDGVVGVAVAAGGQVQNFGTVLGAGTAVSLVNGGSVANGSPATLHAVIAGGAGILAAGSGPVTVANYATIAAVGTAVTLGQGLVFNGDDGDSTASIVAGAVGVAQLPGAGGGLVVDNAGTILAKVGVQLVQGTVSNGSVADPGALIAGSGIGAAFTGAGGLLVNAGTITGGATGVLLSADTAVRNGDEFTRAATIAGGQIGVVALNQPASNIVNGATIDGTTGVWLDVGGSLRNGSATDVGAVISGSGDGVAAASGAVSITNFGTILGQTAIDLAPATRYSGVADAATADGAVYNYGTLASTVANGTAVTLGAGNDQLFLSPGSIIIGKVVGGAGGNLLALTADGGGVGVISGIGSQYVGFQTYAVDPGADWLFNGANLFAFGSTLHNAGTMALGYAATIDIEGALVGSGRFDFGPGGGSTLMLALAASGGAGAVFAPAVSHLAVGDSVVFEGLAGALGSAVVPKVVVGAGGTAIEDQFGHVLVTLSSLTEASAGETLVASYSASGGSITLGAVGAAVFAPVPTQAVVTPPTAPPLPAPVVAPVVVVPAPPAPLPLPPLGQTLPPGLIDSVPPSAISVLASLSGGTTANTFYNASITNVVAGSTVLAGPGNDTVTLGGGDYGVTLGGYNDVVTAGVGRHGVAGSLGGATIRLGDGYDSVSAGGYNNMIAVGANAGGAGFTLIDAGMGNATVLVGNGNSEVVAGGYGDRVSVGGGVNYIFGSPAASGSTISGNATVTLGDTPGITSHDWVFLNGYGNVVNLSAGVNHVTSGQGNDVFNVNAFGGELDLSRFNTPPWSGDVINLHDFGGGASLAGVRTVSGWDTVFTFTNAHSQVAAVVIKGDSGVSAAALASHLAF